MRWKQGARVEGVLGAVALGLTAAALGASSGWANKADPVSTPETIAAPPGVTAVIREIGPLAIPAGTPDSLAREIQNRYQADLEEYPSRTAAEIVDPAHSLTVVGSQSTFSHVWRTPGGP